MNRMTLAPINDGDLLYIVRNMRAADRDEIFATQWSSSPNYLVDACMAAAAAPTSYTIMAYWDGRPAAVLGGIEPWPGCWDVWAFGTDEFDRVAFGLTKHIRRVFIPTLLARGLRRAHCRSMVGHTKVHAWLHDLGARQCDDRVMRGWGKNGEDFIMFEWHRDVLLETYSPAEAA